LNNINGIVFLAKVSCQLLPSLVLLAKLQCTEDDGKSRRSSVLGELLPMIKVLDTVEDWAHLAEILTIPVDGRTSLANVLRDIDHTVDLRLKNQVVTAIRMLAHYGDFVNKTPFILQQIPPTTLADLHKDWMSGMTEKELTAKVCIENVLVNGIVSASVFMPRIFDLNTTSLVTYNEYIAENRFVRADAQTRIVERLLKRAYVGDMMNPETDVRIFSWEMKTRMTRCRIPLAKQTLLCDQSTTLDSIRKELTVDMGGKQHTNMLFTSLQWKFNPEHKKNDIFDSNFKLVSRFGYQLTIQPEMPAWIKMPICLDLESSSRQSQLNDLAMEDLRLMNPGLCSMFRNIEREIFEKFKTLKDYLDDNILNHCLVKLGVEPPKDGSAGCSRGGGSGNDNSGSDNGEDTQMEIEDVNRNGRKSGKKK